MLADRRSNWGRRLVAVGLGAALAGGSLLTTGPVAQAAEPTGLVVAYALNETTGTTAVDSSGNNRNATINGGATLTGAEGVRLDGTDDYIKLPDNILAGLSSITVSTEVLVRTAQTGSYFIYGMGNTDGSGVGNGYLFATGNSTYRSAIATGNWTTEQNASSSAALTRDVWKTLTYTIDDATDTAILYLDGVQVAKNTAVTNKPSDIGGGVTTANYIGRSVYTADKYLAGSVRNFRIYDKALTAGEVLALSGNTTALASVSLSDPSVLKIAPQVDASAHTVVYSVKPGTDRTKLKPVFDVVDGVTVAPASGSEVDLTTPKTYTLTAGSTTTTWTMSSQVMNTPVLPGTYADPNIAVFGGTYYIYATTDGYSGWGGKDFYVWKSADLANWTRSEKPFLTLDGASGNVPWASGNAWAPTIIEKAGKYYFYFSGHNPTYNRKTIGVAVADSPEGPFTAQPTAMILNNESVTSGQAIDPAAFHDPVSGKDYLFWGNGSALYGELSDDMLSIKSGTIKKISSGLTNFREGTFLNYRNGTYHLTYSIDDTGSENYRVGYATSSSVDGPWTYRGEILKKDATQGILATGHSSIINVPGTDEWYIAYHRFAIPGGDGTHRETTIDRLTIGSDGLFQTVTPTLTGPEPRTVPDQNALTVTIQGAAKVGQSLKAVLSSGWTAKSYRWLRAGVAIDGATAQSYSLQAADQGKTVTVDVTATRALWPDATASATTATVAAATAPPVLKYSFDEFATGAASVANTGSLGSGNDGVVKNALTAVDDGNGGKAISFAGGTSSSTTAPYVTIPTGVIKAGQEDLTITARIKLAATANTCQWPLALGQDNTKYVFMTTGCGGNTYAAVKNSTERIALGSGLLPAGSWVDVRLVLDGGDRLYYFVNGQLAGEVATTYKASDLIGTSQSGWLGKSAYSADPYFAGAIDDFTVYDEAVFDVDGMWSGLLAKVPFTDGEVIKVHADETRTLKLPTGMGASWTSSDNAVIDASNGVVRPQSSAKSVKLTLTMSLGGQERTKEFRLTVREPQASESYGYLMTHFVEDSAGYAEKIYFDVSRGDDPTIWDRLNGGNPVLASQLNSTGVRDPYMVRNPETGKYYIIGTDLRVFGCVAYESYNCSSGAWGADADQLSPYLIIWESDNLVDWSDPWQLKVGQGADQRMAWAPEATWVPELGKFVLYWSSKVRSAGYTEVLYGFTADFRTAGFSYGGVLIDRGHDVIDTTVYQYNGYTYRVSKDNGDANTGIWMEVTDAKQWWLPGTTWTTIQTVIGKADYGSVEGPLMFKDTSKDVWYLYIDQYGSAQGYRPYRLTGLGTANPADVKITKMALTDLQMLSTTKHGVVTPLPLDRYEALRKADSVAAIPSVKVTTRAGEKPGLPGTVSVTYRNSLYGPATGEQAVAWDAVDASKYATVGSFEVRGVVSGVVPNNQFSAAKSSTLTVTAVVTVQPSVSALESLLADASALASGDYTASSWAELTKALDAARAVAASATATQAQVDAARDALAAARVGLKVDHSLLASLVSTASGLTASDYSAASWAKVKAALDEGNQVLGSSSATHAAGLEVAAKLAKALADLTAGGEAGVNTEALAAAVAAVEGRHQAGDFTAGSWGSFASALTAAKQTLANSSASQAAVNDALSQLIRTSLGLVSRLGVASVDIASVQWTGRTITSGFVLTLGDRKLVAGTDYALSGFAGKDIGEGSVVVTGVGDFTGTATVSFSIVPKSVPVKKVVAGKGKLTVSWTRTSSKQKLKGYQVGYRQVGTTAWKTVSTSAKKSSVTVKRLAKGKAYEVQVRSYKLVDGVTYSADWSSPKTSSPVR